jgi:Cu/Ag efflux protein CusF
VKPVTSLFRPLLSLTFIALAAAVFAADAQTHRGKGVVMAIQDDGQVLVIDHETIPGYMDAMVMPFELANTAMARAIKVGDRVAFTITQNGDFWPITSLKKIPPRKGSTPKPLANSPEPRSATPTAVAKGLSGAAQ